MPTTFFQHSSMLLRRAFREFGIGRDMGLGAFIAALGLGLQVWWELIPVKDWQEHKWHWVISVVAPFVLVLGGHALWRLITAPWRVHQDQEGEMETLREFQKAVNEKEVHLEPSNPLCSTFVTNFNWETGSSPGLCLRSGFTNNRKPGLPGKTAYRVKANLTYFDGEREPFTIEGRWVRTNQPAAYSPLQDKTEILRVDFEPGTCHELDIANKLPFEPGCYAVAWNDLRARMLVGPIVKVKIELIAEYVYQVFECVFETSMGKLEALDS
jgi:hypothetical protein